MTKRLQAFLQLIRPKDYFFFVLAYSLLGIAAAQGEFAVRFVLVCAANFSAVAFTFIFNQVADAPADTFSETKSPPNPIAQGKISSAEARLAACAAAVISLLLFWLLDWRLVLVGLVLLSFGFLYSSRGTRMHGISMLDLAGHSWLLAPALSLSGFLAFQPHLNSELLFLFLTVVFLSLIGEITHEQAALRALKEVPARQTVLNISARAVHFLIVVFAGACLLSGIILFFFPAGPAFARGDFYSGLCWDFAYSKSVQTQPRGSSLRKPPAPARPAGKSSLLGAVGRVSDKLSDPMVLR